MKRAIGIGLSLGLALGACTEEKPALDLGTGSVQLGDDGPDVPIDESTDARQDGASIPASVLARAAGAETAFAADLFPRVRAAAQGNVTTAPLPASIALAMAAAGAKGDTATQMAAALHAGSLGATLYEGQNGIAQALATRAAAALAADRNAAALDDAGEPSPGDYRLDLVAGVWGESSYPWASPFLGVLASDYGTGVYLADFAGAAGATASTIDAFVSEQTGGAVGSYLPAKAIDAGTRMALVDAVHVRLPWQTPFDPSRTATAPFTRADGTTVQAPTMRGVVLAGYTDDGLAQIVALPLAGGALAVVLAVPRGSLAAYEAQLGATPLAFTAPSSRALVDVALPKVTFAAPTASIRAELEAMGMTDAFDANADFSGACATTPDGTKLELEDVLDAPVLSLLETGVEAQHAVGTPAPGSTDAGPGHVVIPVHADRPFLVAVVDVPTGVVLVVGDVEDPTR